MEQPKVPESTRSGLRSACVLAFWMQSCLHYRALHFWASCSGWRSRVLAFSRSDLRSGVLTFWRCGVFENFAFCPGFCVLGNLEQPAEPRSKELLTHPVACRVPTSFSIHAPSGLSDASFPPRPTWRRGREAFWYGLLSHFCPGRAISSQAPAQALSQAPYCTSGG